MTKPKPRHTRNPKRTSLCTALTYAILLGAAAQVGAQEVGVIGDPESWKTEEFDADWGLGAIGAEFAYARGLTGNGITLGQFDTGVDLTHSEFAGRDHIALTLGDAGCTRDARNVRIVYDGDVGGCMLNRGNEYNANAYWFIPNNGDPYAYVTYGSHGTHVAGTMVASRDGTGMHGVAFGSRLATARFFSDVAYRRVQNPDGTWGNQQYIGSSLGGGNIDGVTQTYAQLRELGARALNIEVQYSTEDSTVDDLRVQYQADREHWDAIADGAIQSNIINVVAAGNYASIPNLYPGLPLFRPDAEAYYIAVGALERMEDGSYDIASYSNRCDYAMNWCVMAPGSAITSSVVDSGDTYSGTFGGSGTAADPYWFEYDSTTIVPEHGYADYYGTSMAAPHAIGALGLLFERFPYLTSTQVRDVLLTTATDMGAAGVDDIYGWGMIDLRKAIDGPGMLLVDTEVAMNQRAGGAKVWEGEAWDDWRNDISGPGRMTKSGAGWLRLSGDNSFAGATVNQGTLELTGANAFSGDVAVNAATFLLGGSMTGSDLSLANGASTNITGSMANGNITSDASSVVLAGSLTGGNLTSTNGPVTVSGSLNGGNLTSSNGPVTLSGTMAGGNLTSSNGAVTVSGALTGNLSSSNGPVLVSGSVNQGNMSISNGSLDLSGALNGGGLSFDTGTANIGGNITGGGIDFRNGTLNLPGNVTGGGLNLVNSTATVNGSIIGGPSVVAAGSTLRGTGSTGDLTVAGTISPGNSIGTFTVNGNYTQAAGSFYDVELTPPSNSDRLNVTGTATLQGGTVRALESSGVYILGQSYRILSANAGVTGQFAALDFSDFASPFIQFGLVYGPNSVDLNVLRGESLATVAVTENEIATATALDSLSNDSALLQAVVMLGIDEIQPVFNQLSGEAHASTQSMLVDGSRQLRNAALTRAGNGHDGFTSQVDDEERFGAWAEVSGNGGDLDGNGNAARVDYDSTATLVGFDYQFDNGWRIGALGGIGRADASFAGRGSSTDVDSRFAGLYTGQRWGGFGLRGGLTYAWNEIEVERDIAFRGFQDQTRAEYDGTTRQAFIEGGYRFDTGVFEIEPYLQYAQVRSEADAFTEEGGAASLVGQADEIDVGLATAGVRFNANLKGSQQEQTWLSLRGGVGYRQANGDELGTANLAFADGSDVFRIQGAPIADKATIAELGLAARLSQNSLLEVGYSGQFADEGDDHGVNARFSVRF